MPGSAASPLVSVLMPAYNHASYIGAAVESVLAQSYANIELIVIDDASTDETWRVLQSFEDRRLRRSRHEVNRGAHVTLNEALALARGEFIAILNSDDVYHPERIARLVTHAAQRGSTDVLVFTDVSFIDAQGSDAPTHPRALDYRALCERCAALPPHLWLLAGNPVISTSNFFVSRALAEKVGAFAPLRYTHDWDWALRASLQRAPVWVREPLLSYRVHAANTLSEDDFWRHVHENSYIQAKALLSLGRAMGETGAPGEVAHAACLALLRNESFHPLALSLYLTCRLSDVTDSEMLAWSCAADGNWMLKGMAEAAAYPGALFRSIGNLAEREAEVETQRVLIEERLQVIRKMGEEIAKRDEAIAAQAALIEERWQTIQHMSDEIAHRDEAIAGQKALIETRWEVMQATERDLAALKADRLVRLALRVRRLARRMAGRRT
jgi:glycosyltransferase involved in cell wall biosynthesis